MTLFFFGLRLEFATIISLIVDGGHSFFYFLLKFCPIEIRVCTGSVNCKTVEKGTSIGEPSRDEMRTGGTSESRMADCGNTLRHSNSLSLM